MLKHYKLTKNEFQKCVNHDAESNSKSQFNTKIIEQKVPSFRRKESAETNNNDSQKCVKFDAEIESRKFVTAKNVP